MTPDPRRLLSLGPRGVWALGEALLLLPTSAAAMSVVGYRRWRGLLIRIPGPAPVRPDQHHASVIARDTARVVAMAARWGPWRPNCLQRSVTLWFLLHRRGVDADLRLGVRPRSSRGVPAFHAWVELDGRVLNDRPDIGAEYRAFGGVLPPSPALEG